MAKEKTEKPVKSAGNAADQTSDNISLRGNTFVGVVVSAKAHKTCHVQWERQLLVKKYERYERRRSRVAAHNPDNIKAKEGDTVRIMESRPLSKTKHFVVTEIIKRAEQ